MLKSINLDGVKTKNRGAILKLLNNNGAMSRKDIAEIINLTSASITKLCTEMIEENIIVDIGETIDEKRAGRKKQLIDINYKYKMICSVAIEKYTTYITITDLKGTLVDQDTIETNTEISPEEFLSNIVQICKNLLSKNKIKLSSVLGMGVSMRGIVENIGSEKVHTYGIWDKNVEIQKILDMLIPIDIVVENNIKAFAQAEIIYGLGKKYNELLFLKWYPGVGSAIVINGEVYEGRRHKVAELGHFIIEPDGDRCKCGKKGCLEGLTSISTIVNSVEKIYSKRQTPNLYQSTDGDISKISEYLHEYIENKVNDVDDYVNETIMKSISKLALATVNATTILSPEKVVIFGKMFERENIKNEFINQCFNYDNSYNNNYVVESELFLKHSFIGGVAIAINELFFRVGGNEI